MICKNCSAEYDGELKTCPGCGAESETNTDVISENTDTSPEEEKAPDGEAEEENTVQAEDADEAQTADDTEEAEETTEEAAAAKEKAEAQEQEKPTVAKKKEQKKTDRSMMPADKVRRTANLRRELQLRKQQQREKSIQKGIIAIMCLVAALAVAVTVLNLTTDIFEDEDASQKVVAGIAFTPNEEKELELLLAKSFSASRNEFNSSGITAEAFLANINPADSGNVYSILNGVNEALQGEADPAGRFADENGSYAYYKLEESRVDKVLALFGFESFRGENSENYYYCDGYYYFAAREGKATPIVSAEIVKSRRVLDGSFYVEGYFYAEKNGETIKTDNYHFVIEMVKDAATGESTYTIKKVSKKPVFGSDGKLVDSANAKLQKRVIEGYTDGGKLFCVYNLLFPVVEGDSQGYVNLNGFMENAVSVYEMKAKSAQQSYNDFKKNGGDDSKLPLVENLIASVIFEDEKNLSLRLDISSYNPAADNDGVYKRTVEAYTFDKATGNFVSKDDVLGKNYLIIGELLYRIYNGYDYESIIPKKDAEEEADIYDDVPGDIYGTGAKIYESAWACTDDGVTFFYLTEKGYVSEIAIPADVVKKLK